MSDQLSDLKAFVESYRDLEREIANDEIISFKKFLEGFEEKQVELAELMRRETPDYNLFDVLRIRHYEAKVHTPFLAHLLNPKASHSQGRLFFNSFLEAIFPQVFSSAQIKDEDIKVLVERRNAFGQIDIELRFREQGIRKAIVIENKIYHHDEGEQLYRYYQYLKSKGIKDTDCYLIYLTLNGKQPSANSLGKTPACCLKTVSYYKEIYSWLTEAIKEMDKVYPNRNSLYYTLSQYLKTIENLLL